MIITVCIYIIEHYKFKEPLNIHHPGGDIVFYCNGYIFKAALILEIFTISLLIPANHSSEVLHGKLGTVRQYIKPPGYIYPLPIFSET